MGNYFIQHIPGFVDGAKRYEFEFNDWEDLYKKIMDNKLAVAHRYKKEDFMRHGNHIMVVTTNPDWWWVIGRTLEIVEELPEWRKNEC